MSDDKASNSSLEASVAKVARAQLERDEDDSDGLQSPEMRKDAEAELAQMRIEGLKVELAQMRKEMCAADQKDEITPEGAPPLFIHRPDDLKR